jgi:CO/xanthine dehydrogenase Mo-binding subunit
MLQIIGRAETNQGGRKGSRPDPFRFRSRPTGIFIWPWFSAYEAPAKVLRIDSGQAERMPAVVRVFTAADIPGINQIGIIPMTKDQPVLSDGVVRYPGEAVALVAAETKERALEAARAVVLELEPRPGVFDPLKALEPEAPLVHEKGNLLFRQGVVKGDAEGARQISLSVETDLFRFVF